VAKRGLGRGLDALIQPRSQQNEDRTGVEKTGLVELPVDQLAPNPLQPRTVIDEERLRELADSIGERGLVQPIVVRPGAGGGHEIIAGERRWRAAALAGMTTVPVIVRPCSDEEALALALVENLQREDLNPIEEAEGYRSLIERFGLRQEDVAERVGRSRPAVANALRLLNLPDDVRELLASGALSVGHAKVLLSMPVPAEQSAAAVRVVREGWSVRMLESWIERRSKGGKSGTGRPVADRDPLIVDVEERLQQLLGTRVRIESREGRGKIEIEYYSVEELNRLLEALGLDHG
jgi:ParB family chromosome partitioning protein